MLSGKPSETSYIPKNKNNITIRELYDRNSDTVTEENIGHHQNSGFSPLYYHIVHHPLLHKKFKPLNREEKTALFIINPDISNLSQIREKINILIQKDIICYVYISKIKQLFKHLVFFPSDKNIKIITHLKYNELLSLIHKVDIVLVQEYEDCIEAVLMAKKILLTDELDKSTHIEADHIRNPEILRGITLPAIDKNNSVSMFEYMNNKELNRNTKLNRFEKKLNKFKRDPKRFLLDSRFSLLRKLGTFL